MFCSSRLPSYSLLQALVLIVCLGPPALAGTTSTSAGAAPAAHPRANAFQSRGKRKKVRATVLEPFVGDLASAKTAGKERNVPVLIHIILEGEPENDTYRDTVLPHKDLIAASYQAVVLIANNGEHPLKSIKERIEGRELESQVCSVYPWFKNCEQHRASWDTIYVAYHEDSGDLRCPQTVIIAPDGKQFWRRNDRNPAAPKDVLGELSRAQKAAGPGLSREDLSTIKRLQRDANRSTEGKLLGAAWREWNGVLEITEVGAYADLARKARAALEPEMSKRVAEIASKLLPGEAADAYAKLAGLLGSWHGTPAAAEITKIIKRAERNKAIRDEIRAWKLEREASTLLAQASALDKPADEKALRKVLRKLFSKKFAGTAAQAEGLKTYPQYAPSSGKV